MTISLKSEIEKRNNEGPNPPSPIPPSTGSYLRRLLTIEAAKEYEYGAPKQFFDGHVSSGFPRAPSPKKSCHPQKYIGKTGRCRPSDPLSPAERRPEQRRSSATSSSVAEELPQLTKYYDGTPLVPGLSIDDGDNKIPTDDGKTLTDPSKVKMPAFGTDQQTPSASRRVKSETMPLNVGYAGSPSIPQWCTDPAFSTNYWGIGPRMVPRSKPAIPP